MEAHFETGTSSEKNIARWLYNPFHYIAGGKALVIGAILILGAGLTGSVSNSHFDGLLDFHTGAPAPLWMFVSEGLLDWIVMGCLLLLGGKIISKSRIRPLDVFGTQALARSPMIVTVLFALLPGYQRFAQHLAAQYVNTIQDVQTNPSDGVMFAITALVAVLMLVWMVTLMYRGYSISCNVAGGKAIGVFIGAILVGEAISKVLIIAIASAAALNPL